MQAIDHLRERINVVEGQTATLHQGLGIAIQGPPMDNAIFEDVVNMARQTTQAADNYEEPTPL